MAKKPTKQKGIKYNRQKHISDKNMATKFDPRLKEVVLYTDGSCLKNRGAGGVAAIVRFGEHHKTVQEGFRPQPITAWKCSLRSEGWIYLIKNAT